MSAREHHLSPRAQVIYHQMMQRVSEQLGKDDSVTSARLDQEIQDALNGQRTPDGLTEEELTLLGRYMKDDLEYLLYERKDSLGELREWLQLDMSLLEHELADKLLSVADQTRIDNLELLQKLENEDAGYFLVGELATEGTLRCASCGHMVCLTEPTTVEPCTACQSHYFQRVTRLPDES